jgi:hypothetical protein
MKRKAWAKIAEIFDSAVTNAAKRRRALRKGR